MTITLPPKRASLPVGPLRPRHGIAGTRALDTIVLLDGATEQYLTLHEVAARIWELLCEGLTPVAIVDRLCEEYDASREQVAGDVGAQLKSWLRSGLIEPGPVGTRYGSRPLAEAEPTTTGPAAARATTVAVPSVLRCGLMIFGVKAIVATRGFTRTLDWIRRRVERIPATISADVTAVRRLEWSVAMAGGLYPGRARCLEQSLVLYYLLRRQGVAARYCQGVQPHPFRAHAWIEYRGEIINDVEEHVVRFARLPEQLP